MLNFVQKGDSITVTAPAAVSSGDFLLIGKIGGFAATDAAEDAEVELVTRGVFEVTLSGAAFGDAVFWTGTAFSLTPTNNTRVGVAAAPSAGGKTRVKLDAVIS